ncbi:MAG TPA: DUF3800 domain-containing protein [Gemmatimonadaceae bacterium]
MASRHRIAQPAPTLTVLGGYCRRHWYRFRAARDRRVRVDAPLFLFFDESGSFQWTDASAPLYHFGVVTTFRPAVLEHALAPIRLELFGATGDQRLHASEDRQAVRDRVFGALRRAGAFEFDAITIDKRRLPESLLDPAAFYPHFAALLLDAVFDRHALHRGRVVLVTDRLPLNRKRGAVEKAFKTYMRRRLPVPREFTLVHEPSGSFAGLQAADYCTWAVHKLRLHHDERPYAQILPFVRRVVEVGVDGEVLAATPRLHFAAAWPRLLAGGD